MDFMSFLATRQYLSTVRFECFLLELASAWPHDAGSIEPSARNVRLSANNGNRIEDRFL